MGVDGSEQSMTAAAWAAAEADRRRAEVRVVMVNDDPPRDEEIWGILGDVLDRVAVERPTLEISPKIARGHPSTELIERSESAQLLVVGSRGRGAVATTLLGSISADVSTHAHCPVVVVPHHHAEGPVVLGLDDSGESRPAVRFAFEAAVMRECELVAMQVWQDPRHPASGVTNEATSEEVRALAERSLAEQLAGWSETHPDVAVRTATPRGNPVTELAAQTAQLLVVGHHRRSWLAERVLGSVTLGLLRHSLCPVAVISDENP